MSLLDKAKEHEHEKNNPEVPPEELELVVAYLKDEISLMQVANALEYEKNRNPHARALSWISTRLMRAIRHDQIFFNL